MNTSYCFASRADSGHFNLKDADETTANAVVMGEPNAKSVGGDITRVEKLHPCKPLPRLIGVLKIT